MGKFATSDKPKFDLITASKTKKYKIIVGVVLGLGILMLIGGILLHSLLTQAVTANSLDITNLSGLKGEAPYNYKCDISQDQYFSLSTGTALGRPLSNAITFELDENAQKFATIRDEKMNTLEDNQSNYPGGFYICINDDAPDYISEIHTDANRPSGYLTIYLGQRKMIKILLTYYAN